MKFSTKEDIEAPIDYVFDALTDFDAFERLAMRRGAEVQRTDRLRQVGPGMRWQVRFNLRGKPRDVAIELVSIDRANALAVEGTSGSFEGSTDIELLRLSPRRTRINIQTEIKPKTLAARVLMQSLKLARSKLTKRYHMRVHNFALDLESRYRRENSA